MNKFITLYDIFCTDLTCEHPQFRTRNGVIGISDSFTINSSKSKKHIFQLNSTLLAFLVPNNWFCKAGNGCVALQAYQLMI